MLYSSDRDGAEQVSFVWDSGLHFEPYRVCSIFLDDKVESIETAVTEEDFGGVFVINKHFNQGDSAKKVLDWYFNWENSDKYL